MAKYLKKFNTHSEYEEYASSGSMIKPNVSYCNDDKDVYYNPFMTDAVSKINITETGRPVVILSAISGFSSVEIDGVKIEPIVSSYTFTTAGEHSIKYTFVDETKVSPFAFAQCNDITSITIPDNITSIGNAAFAGSSGLTSITIPDNITSISAYAFSNCVSLVKVNLPSELTHFEDGVFGYCTSLTSITIPNGITQIPYYAFQHCESLTNIIIPDNIITIIDTAFLECKRLLTLTIGSGITSIGGGAFYNCSGLTNITILATTPPTLGSQSFDNTNNCPIYVPSESVEAYKSATTWSTYASRIQAIQ